MQIAKLILALAATTLLVTGCAKQKGTAQEALKGVEDSLVEVRQDAAKYAAEGLKSVEAQLARLQDSFNKKEYENVIAGAPQLDKAVDSLKAAVESGKQHAKAAVATAKIEWENLNAEVPNTVASIQTRIDDLAKRKVRFTVSKEELESARSGLDWMKATWGQATAAANDGHEIEAAEMAKSVKAKGEEVKKSLGMKDA